MKISCAYVLFAASTVVRARDDPPLDAKVTCEGPSGPAGQRRVFLDLDYAAFEALGAPPPPGPPGPPIEFSLPLEDSPECMPFKHVYFVSNPVGHPDWDGKGNGYGQVHLDVHFYTIPIEERVELMGECGVQPPGAPNCPSAIPANAPFYKLPPAAYTTGFFNQDAFFGHALPMHGLHMVPNVDAEEGGPANCVSTGPKGNWEDCMDQQLSILMPPQKFVDAGCTCGEWTDGVSPILLSFDGKVYGSEIMPTVAHGARLGEDLPNPFFKAFPAQDKYMTTGYQPTSTYSERADDRLHLGLVLTDEEIEATPVNNACEDSDAWVKNGNEDADCKWVAEHEPRCRTKGTMPGTLGKVMAWYACPAACNTPCTDSASWSKLDEPLKTCAWASFFPDKRCDVRGQDGVTASDACPAACGS